MTLERLIAYWKDRLLPHPPMTPTHWPAAVHETIIYLEELRDLKKGGTD